MNERLCWEEELFVLRNAHIIHMIQTFYLSEISWTKSILCSQPHLDWRTRRIKIDLRDEHGCWHDQTSARVERRMLPSASIRRRPITSCKCPFPPLRISVNLFTQFSISKGELPTLKRLRVLWLKMYKIQKWWKTRMSEYLEAEYAF
jgi:hypothetical protein